MSREEVKTKQISNFPPIPVVPPPLTDAEIKQQYENNLNTNEFNDQEKEDVGNLENMAFRQNCRYADMDPFTMFKRLLPSNDLLNITAQASDSPGLNKVIDFNSYDTRFCFLNLNQSIGNVTFSNLVEYTDYFLSVQQLNGGGWTMGNFLGTGVFAVRPYGFAQNLGIETADTARTLFRVFRHNGNQILMERLFPYPKNVHFCGDRNPVEQGDGVMYIRQADQAPVAGGNVIDGGILFVENGALKYKGSSGTITEIAPA
ncbi:MAG: hypothetical protein AAFN93_02670 [Bacteroidota bacterium]